ncbi:MAG: hypothetical protein ACLGIA_13435 [Actinomycetes bacterium]
MSDSAPPPAPKGLTRQDFFSLLGALGAILTLLTTIMFYFGWRRSEVQASAMNIDVSLFDFSTQDYVLRSISSLYLPLLVLFGLGLAWLRLHVRLRTLLHFHVMASQRRRAAVCAWATRVGWTAAGVATVTVVFALVAGLRSPPPLLAALAVRLRGEQWLVPLVLLVGALVAQYAWWVRRTLRAERPEEPVPVWQSIAPAALVAGTVLLAGFWMLEEYATAVGRGEAEQLAASVDQLARAVVLSPTPLGIDAPGVHEQAVVVGPAAPSGQPAETRYRTTGLRLLARSGGKVLLLHDGWTPASGTVVVLPDNGDLAWEFSR